MLRLLKGEPKKLEVQAVAFGAGGGTACEILLTQVPATWVQFAVPDRSEDGRGSMLSGFACFGV